MNIKEAIDVLERSCDFHCDETGKCYGCLFENSGWCGDDFHESLLALLKDPDRIKAVRCKDCRYFEPRNAEEGDNSGYCRNDYAPCQNQTVDSWWFCGSAERVSE